MSEHAFHQSVSEEAFKAARAQSSQELFDSSIEADEKAKKMGVDTADVEGHTAYDIIKIASLIESEAKVPQDRPFP